MSLKVKALKELLENVDDDSDVVVYINDKDESKVIACPVTGIWNQVVDNEFILVGRYSKNK